MRRLYFIAFLFVFINHINAQFHVEAQLLDSIKGGSENVKTCSVYEYGVPITCAEDNFKNLFNNLNSDNFVNAADFELLDYKYLFTITGNEGKENVGFLISSMFSGDSIAVSMSILSSSKKYKAFFPDKKPQDWDYREQKTHSSKISISYHSLNGEESMFLFELFAMGIMREGDKAYLINWKYKGKEMRSYVICDGRTHRVVWDLVFMGCLFWVFPDE